MFIPIENEEKYKQLMNRLPEVFGIQSFSPVASCSKDLEDMKALALAIMEQYRDAGNMTFKVEVRRTDKTFPLDSHALQREMGGTILPQFDNISVNVRNPDVSLRIEVREDAVYMMAASR